MVGIVSGIQNAFNYSTDAIHSAPLRNEASSHGFDSVDAYRAWQAQQPTGPVKEQSGFDNFLNTNPVGQAIAPVLAMGGGYNTSTGAHPGIADPVTMNPVTGIQGRPVSQQSIADLNAATDAQINQYNVNQPAFATPPNMGSYNDSLGSTAASLPGSFAPNTNSVDSQGRPLHGPGSADWNATGSDNTAAGGSTYTPPVNTPTNQTGGGDYSGPLLSLGAAGLGAAGSIGGAIITANANKESDKIQQDNLTTQTDLAKPWTDAGARALGKLETFDTDHPAFTYDKLSQDGGYAFRLKEGMDALENSASARGGLLSGNTGKALVKYGQDMGSQEYNNAFNRWNTVTGQQRAGLQSLAGLGQTAVGQVGQANQNYTNAASQGAQNVGNAYASGLVGATSAITNNASAYLNNQSATSLRDILINSMNRNTNSGTKVKMGS